MRQFIRCTFLLLLFTVAGIVEAATVDIPAQVIRDKIRGGLLGQILGNLNGLEHEGKYIAQPGKVTEYIPSLPEGAWTE